jgi:hypothetical protein
MGSSVNLMRLKFMVRVQQIARFLWDGVPKAGGSCHDMLKRFSNMNDGGQGTPIPQARWMASWLIDVTLNMFHYITSLSPVQVLKELMVPPSFPSPSS